MNIYVGNLPRASSEDAVRKAFEAHGQVADVKLIKDNFTGELRGFGFVEMPNKAEAIAAMQALNGADFEGRKLVVNEARPKTDRRGGGGGGFGGGRPRSWYSFTIPSPIGSLAVQSRKAFFMNAGDCRRMHRTSGWEPMG